MALSSDFCLQVTNSTQSKQKGKRFPCSLFLESLEIGMTGSKLTDDVIRGLSSLFSTFWASFSVGTFIWQRRTTGNSRLVWALLKRGKRHLFPRYMYSVSWRESYWICMECGVLSLARPGLHAHWTSQGAC